jgi:hypothetical protein
MKRTRFSEEQIAFALRQVQGVEDLEVAGHPRTAAEEVTAGGPGEATPP